MESNKIKEKKAMLEVLEDLIIILEEKEKDTKSKLVVIGQEQRKNWETKELLWEDEEKTIPKMRDIYENRPKEETEIDEYDRIRLNAINTIKTALEKLI